MDDETSAVSPDLATAEVWLREVAGCTDPNSTSQHAFTRTGVALHVLLAEYDRRTSELTRWNDIADEHGDLISRLRRVRTEILGASA